MHWLFATVVMVLSIAPHILAQTAVVPHRKSTFRTSQLTFEQVRRMTPYELRRELIRRGVPAHLAEQGADHLQSQVGRDSVLKGPGKEAAGMIDLQDDRPGVVDLPSSADVSWLDKVRSSQLMVRIPGTRDIAFGIVNGTDLNGAFGLHKSLTYQSRHYTHRPRKFSIFGITKSNKLFHVNLLSGSGDTGPGSTGKRFNVAAFRLGREHYPVRLYLADGSDLGWPQTGIEPDSQGRGPVKKPSLLRDYLEEHAELTLDISGGHTSLVQIVIAYDARSGRYVFVEGSTLENRGDKACW